MVLDNCDGEIARAKNMKSALGAWLDIVADFVTDVSLFLGIAAGCLRQGVEGPVGLFAFLCLSGGLLHLTLVILEKLKGFGPAVYENPNPGTEARQNPVFIFFDALREGEASWFIVIFCVLGKALWLLWFGGVYMQVLWMSALILNFRHLAAKKAVR
jgi:phosphatidylglycerophosphate synthase